MKSRDIRNWCNSVFNVPLPQRQIPSNLPSWICSSLLWPHYFPSVLIPVLRRDSTEVQADKQQMNSFCALIISEVNEDSLHRPVFPYLQSTSAHGDIYIQLQEWHESSIYLSRWLCQTHHHGTCTFSYNLWLQKAFGGPHSPAGSQQVQGTSDAALELFGEEGKCQRC